MLGTPLITDLFFTSLGEVAIYIANRLCNPRYMELPVELPSEWTSSVIHTTSILCKAGRIAKAELVFDPRPTSAWMVLWQWGCSEIATKIGALSCVLSCDSCRSISVVQGIKSLPYWHSSRRTGASAIQLNKWLIYTICPVPYFFWSTLQCNRKLFTIWLHVYESNLPLGKLSVVWPHHPYMRHSSETGGFLFCTTSPSICWMLRTAMPIPLTDLGLI